MKEQRKHVRIPGSATIALSWMEGGGPKSVQSTCIDVAAGGMRVDAPEQVPASTNVTFSIPDADFEGGTARVRYTTRNSERFIVGLEFTEDTSRELFAYSHESDAL